MVDSAFPVTVRQHVWIPVTVVVAPREIVGAIVRLGGHLDHVRVTHLVDLERNNRFFDGCPPKAGRVARVSHGLFLLRTFRVLTHKSEEFGVLRLALVVSLVSFFSLFIDPSFLCF